MKFTKPALTIDQQFNLLKDRGLLFENEKIEKKYLADIGYFRLSGYFKYYQDTSDQFEPGIKFSDIINLYIFDRKLRLLIFDAIERLEVATRSHMNNHMSINYGNHWYIETANYKEDATGLIQEINEEITKSKEIFIKNYKQKYTQPEMPPSWMVLEVLSLGQIANIFRKINHKDQKTIAYNLGFNQPLIASWLPGLSQIRNACAHHVRTWNRRHTWNIIIPQSSKIEFQSNNSTGTYIKIIDMMLEKLIPESKWTNSVSKLLEEYKIPLKEMELESFFDES